MKSELILPPPIEQYFDPCLLMTFLERLKWKVEKKVLLKAKKKIREIDTGKRKRFEMMLKEFWESYERKTNEEKIYKAEIEKSKEKRPYLSPTGGTCVFRRVHAEK